MEEWLELFENFFEKGKYRIESISVNTDGLKIFLSNDINRIEFSLNNYIAFKRYNENVRIKRRKFTIINQNNRSLASILFFKINNSEFSKWVEEESCGFHRIEKVSHYCIVTEEDYVDILTYSKPNIRVLSNQK